MNFENLHFFSNSNLFYSTLYVLRLSHIYIYIYIYEYIYACVYIYIYIYVCVCVRVCVCVCVGEECVLMMRMYPCNIKPIIPNTVHPAKQRLVFWTFRYLR